METEKNQFANLAGNGKLAKCEVCGNEYDKCFGSGQIISDRL